MIIRYTLMLAQIICSANIRIILNKLPIIIQSVC